MSSLKNKIKINNSYESEPSSGSGSYLSEYYEHCSVEEGDVPKLFKPPVYDDVVVANTTSEPLLTTTHSVQHIHKERIDNIKEKSLPLSKECEIRFGIPVRSSQETTFQGFTGSPLGKIKKLLQTNKGQHTDLAEESFMDNEKLTGLKSFYDITIAENSCNAVDMQLSREKSKSPKMYNTEDCARSELSFNGKIKVFNINKKEEEDDDEHTTPETNGNKSWRRQFSDSFTLKKYSNEKSPDLFAEDDESNNEERQHIATVAEQNVSASSQNNPLRSSVINNNKRNNNYYKKCQQLCRIDESMQERIRKRLSGVLPPPSVTIPQLDMFEAVLSRKDEILNFFKTTTTEKTCPENQKHNNNLIDPSLLKPTCSLEEAKSTSWPEILALKQHGLSYNLCQASESNEYLSLSVIERFIGAETASSYRNSSSNPKKQTSVHSRNNCQSPGSRLSHLARRRAIFSSANLANNFFRTHNQIGPQILLDKRKSKTHSKGNTPKRKTPGSKKKRRKTPGSSARKRLFRSETNNPTAPTVETLKRALFQSPPKQEVQTLKSSFSTAQLIKSNQRVEKSKRALLFSPEKGESQSTSSYYSSPHSSNQQPSKTLKRKRDTSVAAEDFDDSVDLALQSSKLFKATNESGGLTPRALNIKSQSFCMGGTSSTPNQLQQQHQQFSFARNRALASNSRLLSIESNSSVYTGGSKMQRAFSDTFAPTNSLTDNQKKKLLWAVSQALQEKKITVKHDNFKQYAAILARVVRRIFQQYYQKISTSNSETMLRLAKRYVYQVMQGFSLDDIYFQAKQQIEESRRPNTKRLSGYIGPLEYEQLQQQEQETKASNSISLKQNTTKDCQNIFGQSSLTTSQITYNDVIAVNTSPCATLECKGSVATSANLQNSSSKSNLNGSVLRENVDCVRSAQKSFTGKDQRNMSPYASNNVGAGGGQSSAVKIQTQPIHVNSAKARRQITFDN